MQQKSGHLHRRRICRWVKEISSPLRGGNIREREMLNPTQVRLCLQEPKCRSLLPAAFFKKSRLGKERRLREITTSLELPHKLQWTSQTTPRNDPLQKLKFRLKKKNWESGCSLTSFRDQRRARDTAAGALTPSQVHRCFQGTERFSRN